jgi:nucleoside phosphorylase
VKLEDLRYVRSEVVERAWLRAASGAPLTNDQLDQVNQAMADLLTEKGWNFEGRAFLLKVSELSSREPSKRALSIDYVSKLRKFLDVEIERRTSREAKDGKSNKKKGPMLRESLTNGERPRWKKEPTPAKGPALTEVGAKTLERRVGRVEVLLLTATPTEWAAALRTMKPLPAPVAGTLDGRRYVVGRVGRHLVALTRSRPGSGTRDGSLLTVRHAIDRWNPRAVIALGIAFGGYTAKQKISDVLVSTRLFHYEIRREQKPHGIERGSGPDAGRVLLEQFGDVEGWTFFRPDGKKCDMKDGPMLTGEKLVDDLDFKEQLFKRFPEAIGGEMEGSGIYAACSDADHNEWIIVKAVCDWGDGTKGKHYQKVAAAAAASLVEHVLSRKDALTAILRSGKGRARQRVPRRAPRRSRSDGGAGDPSERPGVRTSAAQPEPGPSRVESLVTGGDSFAYCQINADRTGGALSIVKIGEFPLYGLSLRIVDIEAGLRDLFRRDYQEINAPAITGPLPFRLGDAGYYRAFFQARNGSWFQDLVLRHSEAAGCWLAATRVVAANGAVRRVHVDREYVAEFGEPVWRP